jgi:hypothetical protein
MSDGIPAEAGFHRSSQAKHYRRGGPGLVKDASQKGVHRRRRAMARAGEAVPRILDKAGPLAKLAA